ncbi:MAG: folylpolyglutamate synthase/dihydrofolate synthase family protein [Chthoniobacteraceae bacterium]
MNFREAVEWLYGTQVHGIRPGLETTWRLVDALGVDPARMKFIHVAGTNGKGSVCAMLDSICRAAGLKTGLFTSPHLITFRERIRVNGELISEPEVAARLTAIRKLSADWNPAPTFFEITTALALAHFQNARLDVVVLETGMGGSLDSTNIVTPLVSVLTPIDFDHERWLGATLPEIAAEKSGIIKPVVPVVSARQPDEAAAVIKHIAHQRRALLHEVQSPIENVPIGLAGSYQRWNAALAIHALDHARLDIPLEAITRGLASVSWPGRFQRVTERIIVDGAHNPAAARCLVETWREVFGEAKATLVLGALQDKNLRGICEVLLPIAARVIAVTVQNPRSTPAEEICKTMRSLAPDFDCVPSANLPHALATANAFPAPILVAGSLFLVGETLAFLHNQETGEVSVQ